MAVGPNDFSQDALSEKALTLRLEEDIDRQLADSDRTAPTADLVVSNPLPSRVEAQVRSRYLEAGWGEVTFKRVSEGSASTHYAVAFRR